MEAAKLLGLVLLGLTACSHAPKPTRYILEGGSAGWVKVTYNTPDAPSLPVEDGFTVVHLSSSLHLITSSPMNPSWDNAEFYYQTKDGKRVRLSAKDDNRRRLWGLEKVSDNTGDRELFFVGKQDQFTHMGTAAGDMGTGQWQASSPDPNSAFDIPDDPVAETAQPK